jgi:hypothetical protein
MTHCPSCRCLVAFDKSLFHGARCEECTSTLFVSATYIRALLLLSFAAAEALLCMVNIRKIFFPSLGVPFGFMVSAWLGFPVAFLILTALVRTVPRLVAPKLLLRQWSTVTTLELN